MHHYCGMNNWNIIILPLIAVGLIAFWYGVGHLAWDFITRPY